MNQHQISPALTTSLRGIAMASALCCASLAQAQSTVTLYGIVDAAVVFKTNQTAGSTTSIDAGQLATSRWGMKGSEDLGGGLKANFALEGTLANDTGAGGGSFGTPLTANLFDRISTVGLSGSFGSVNLGRQNMLGVDSIGLADPTGLAHAASNPNVAYSALNSAALFGAYGANGGGSALRQNNSIKYLTPNMSGFGAAVMVGLGENAGPTTSASNYTGISGYFTDGKSGVALAHAKLTNPATNSTLTLTGGGAKYVMGAVTLKGTYAQSDLDTANRKIAVTGLGIDYAVSTSLTLTGAFYNSKLTQGVVSGNADQYLFIAKQALSKRTVLYGSLTLAKADSAGAADISMAGGLITGAGQTDATRLAFGVMHSF